MRSRSRTWPIAASHNFTLLILQRRLSWLAYSSGSDRLQARASAAPPGDGIRHGVAFMPGGGSRLARPTFVRPAVNLFTFLAETAVVGGLNIAETFPEGRGSPHGCGLRAVFCTDAASARPEACREKSKAPRSGDVAGRSPGVQGAAAIGRPLCAPCAIRDITQKTYRERHRPEITQNNRFSGAKPLQTDNRIKLSSPDGQSARASGRSGSVPVAMPDGA
ncbi:putative receptor [Klebsiella variicola]|nr:putative receptor [Klebsiella variicola]